MTTVTYSDAHLPSLRAAVPQSWQPPEPLAAGAPFRFVP